MKRRDFLKNAAMLAAGGTLLPSSIRKAFAIDPAPGSTFLDAEHVVILMQENRSFDHSYGMLRGVRGFNDPRAVQLPDGKPVWFQTEKSGATYAPFRLNIKDTNATWMSALPHSWTDQVDARAHGKHDGWLDSKRSGNKGYAAMPLTMGYYDRQDIPFYYALADAFTVCDQNFCSSLTGTTPNRSYLWTGTIRETPSIKAKANVRNSDIDYDSEQKWKTFPERLEENGISWRVYQNEISLDTGLSGEQDEWLANFTDNPLEWFQQYRVRFHPAHRQYLETVVKTFPAEIAKLESSATNDAQKKALEKKRGQLEQAIQGLANWPAAAFEKLSEAEKNLHRKAFTTNTGDPHYRELTKLKYDDNGTPREMQMPSGDVLHQFRADVNSGKLPTVSWLVAPSAFSDHPGSPWYGAWYLSETLDILTKNPAVWKKTIFILCYDENDGYYDHVPPFVPPDANRPGTGKTSAGIDTSVEYVTAEQEGSRGRTGPIGLGFRVPLVIASPWSRGGRVNSQVCDHTSILQLLEKVLSHKTKRPIVETNISAWRRTVCGDLTSAFKPYQGEALPFPTPVERDKHLGSIHAAQFKAPPSAFKKITGADAAQSMTRQESGTRPSCALPYDLRVTGAISADGKKFIIQFGAGSTQFGSQCAGAPFRVYAPGKTKTVRGWENCRTWDYAVAAGDQISDEWLLTDFENGRYHLRVHGPNGFYREFKGSAADPRGEITLGHGPVGAPLRAIPLWSKIPNATPVIEDMSYRTVVRPVSVVGQDSIVGLDLRESFGWYDLKITLKEFPGFEQRFAGRIETGQESISDPAMA